MAGARAAWGIEGLWGSHQDQARETLLQELFPDVGQAYVDWDLTSGNAFEAFIFKRQEMEPDERLGGHIGQRDSIHGQNPHGPLLTPSPHLGIPGQALQRVPSPPELGVVHRHLERMLA